MVSQNGLYALLLFGWLGNDIGSARSDILADVLSKFWPIKMIL
jgi:hypothetical protein